MMTATTPRLQALLSTGFSVLALVLANQRLSASTIVSVAYTTPIASAGVLTSKDEANEVSWSSANAYNNVSISAAFGQTSYANVAGSAYLMTQIGSGTTTAAQIAFSNFTFPNSTGGTITLFQNLSLGPGSYYLVLYSLDPVGGGWLVTGPGNSKVTTTGRVVFGGSGYYYNPGTLHGPFFPYAPSVPFIPFLSYEQFLFDVQGQLVGANTAPEPSSFGLLAAAALLAALPKICRYRGVSNKLGRA